MHKKDIKNFTLQDLKQMIIDIKEPPYRARQVFSWLYKKGVDNFKDMSNLSNALVEELEKAFYIGRIALEQRLVSSIDKTEKFLFKLEDGNFIESVLIYAQGRKTLCISTQVGCKYSCSFCASGLRGFVRNLSVSEIINQILYLQHNLKHSITNYVFMGMGEPLDNYENLIKAIMIMNDKDAMNIGSRRITVSTCGITPAIEKLKNLNLQVNLSVSLHATNNNLRNKLMPVNRKYPLEELIKACEGYIGKKGRIITLEYILLEDINNFPQDVDILAKMAKRLNAKVNLVPHSPVAGIDYKGVSEKDTKHFMEGLVKKGVKVTVRESKGKDIKAACGQLAGSQKGERK